MRRTLAAVPALPGLVALVGAAACPCACSGAPDVRESPPVELSLETTLAPGAEAYRCRFVRMPKADGEIFVRGGQHTLSPGAHHYLLFRTTLTSIAAEDGAVTDCVEHDGVMKYVKGFVTGGQTPHESADFPAGAAIAFASEEVLLLQAHFLNASAAPLDARVDVVLRTTPADAVEQRAGLLQFYDPFIAVPAHAAASAAMRCPIPKDITLLSAGPHMHRHGKSYAAFLDLPGEPRATTPFYTSDDWEHPTYLLGYQKIPAGSFIRFRCDYQNDDAAPVVQGLSADHDEMCMFGGYYVPAMAPEDEACFGMDGHGTGDRACGDTRACVDACPTDSRPDLGFGRAQVGACWQTCIARSCPNVTKLLFAELRCREASCAAECADTTTAAGDAACEACSRAHCGAEVSACEATACAGE
jgi:hypothetical protein